MDEHPVRLPMNIPEEQKETLETTGEELFLKGACHVFAEELCKEFVEHPYRFCAVRAETWSRHPVAGDFPSNGKELVHVLAWKDDYVIDVEGIKLRAEYLVEWQNKTSDLPGEWIRYYKDIDIQACSREELFEERLTEPMAGPMSRHRLPLHPQFLHEASSRARRIIELARNKFDIERIGSPTLYPLA